MKTLILSDLHLGHTNCQTEQIDQVLECERFDRLILNGDTIDSLNLKKLNSRHWAILENIRRMGRNRQVILVRGNHDHDGPPDGDGQELGGHCVLSTLLETPMIEETSIEAGYRRYVVLHGDRFDPTLNRALLMELMGWCHQMSHKLSKKLAKWLKKKSKRWGGVLKLIRTQSVNYAREQNLEGVITGHTHFPEDMHDDGIHYVNSGCWTEPPCSYLTVNGDGVQLHFAPE